MSQHIDRIPGGIVSSTSKYPEKKANPVYSSIWSPLSRADRHDDDGVHTYSILVVHVTRLRDASIIFIVHHHATEQFCQFRLCRLVFFPIFPPVQISGCGSRLVKIVDPIFLIVHPQRTILGYLCVLKDATL